MHIIMRVVAGVIVPIWQTHESKKHIWKGIEMCTKKGGLRIKKNRKQDYVGFTCSLPQVRTITYATRRYSLLLVANRCYS